MENKKEPSEADTEQTSTTSRMKNENNPAKKPGENREHCQYCDVYLNLEFFKTHQGTKKHKRNVRRWKKKYEDTPEAQSQPSPFAMQALPIEDFSSKVTETCPDIEYQRKKYSTYSDGTIKDTEEVNLITTLLSLRLVLDEKIEDFNISVFNNKWQPFGDLVIEIIKNGQTETNYAIKFKRIPNYKMKLESLNALISMEKELEKAANLKNNQAFDKTKFIISTRAYAPQKIGENWKYQHEISDLEELERLINASKSDNSIFETSSQKGLKILVLTNQYVRVDLIYDIFRKYFNECPEIFKVSREFKRYIENWSSGALGGTYALNKKDILLRMAQIILQDIIVKPIPTKSNGPSLDSYKIWNDIVNEMDLTILKNNPYNIRSISHPINNTIQKIFKCLIKTNGFLEINEKTVDEMKPGIKAYLFEEVSDLSNNIPLSTIYIILWKANQIPLIINDKDNWTEFVLNAMCFLKQRGLKRSFIFLCDDPTDVTPKKELRTFKCLLDIKENPALSQIPVQVSRESDITLSQISESNKFFLQWVTPDVFLNLSLKKCSFKAVVHKYFSEHENSCLQLILKDDELFQKIYKDYCRRGDNVATENKYIKYGHLKGLDPVQFRTNLKVAD